ncbi:MAG TPA: hypothetical protein VGZ00_11100 [Candidatus Baltobacteraceae bacterium]|jgi:hypothetical protein|nr:hypothetical protein [Candidatus Baltobacteraceae bacterium]
MAHFALSIENPPDGSGSLRSDIEQSDIDRENELIESLVDHGGRVPTMIWPPKIFTLAISADSPASLPSPATTFPTTMLLVRGVRRDRSAQSSPKSRGIHTRSHEHTFDPLVVILTIIPI